MTRRALAALVVLFLMRRLEALDPRAHLYEYAHDVWRMEQGLPQDEVRAVTQTRDGYLWIGTVAGLVRFDGLRFTVLNRKNTPAFQGSEAIAALLEDKRGRLWIGTDAGLLRLEDGKLSPVTKSDGTADGRITCISEDRDGNVWAGTFTGLLRIRDDVVRTFTTKDGLPSDIVRGLRGDTQGNLWIGTPRGLSRLSADGFKVFTVKDGLPDDRIFSVAEQLDGSLWIATARGISRFAHGAFVTVTTKDEDTAAGAPNPAVDGARSPYAKVTDSRLYVDREGTLWISTLGSGLVRFREGRLESWPWKEGVFPSTIGATFEDREGSLWAVSSGGGLHRLRDTAFTAVASGHTTVVREDRAGVVWIGTSKGLQRWTAGTTETLTRADGLSSDVVWSIVEDHEGSLWVGVEKGLNRIRGGRIMSFGEKEGVSPRPTALFEDRAGRLWIGMFDGRVIRFENGRFKVATRIDAREGVAAILEASDGAIWIGASSGLVRYAEGTEQTFTTKDGLSSVDIEAIYESGDTLWIGTAGGGLNRLKAGVFRPIPASSGFTSSWVLSILEDSSGDLWMGTENGVVRARRAELDAVADGTGARVSVEAYGVGDGLPSADVVGGSQPAAWKTRDGRLWFATSKGAAYVDPARISRNAVPPPVLIEDVVIDGVPSGLGRSGRGELPPGRRNLDFRYTALSLRVPERVKFRYKLEGYDAGWVDAGTERTAHYTNLRPSTYTFRVIACNDDGVWNEKGASFAVTLAPHYYQTWWFYSLCVLGVAAFGAGAQHVTRLKSRERELVRVVDEKTRALRAAHEEILMKTQAELSRKTQELEYARKVQLALLPRAPLTSGEWTVAGAMQTATEVGGDYYGYLETEGRVCVVIGDATGHGMASGLVAGMLKAVLENLAHRAGPSENPGVWLQQLNSALRSSIAQRGLGVCVGIGFVDTATGKVELGAAGIPHTFHLEAGGRVCRLALSGPPLAYLRRIDPAVATRTLEPGDSLVLLTDGVIEQVDKAGRDWGYEGVERALSTLFADRPSPDELAKRLLAACAEYGAGVEQSDDRTVVVLTRAAG